MSNTYFEIETVSKEWESLEDQIDKKPPFEAPSRVSLTAFVGGEKVVQLTVSKDGGRSTGMGYATLTNDECIQLAGALLERVNRRVSATGDEQSAFQDEQE